MGGYWPDWNHYSAASAPNVSRDTASHYGVWLLRGRSIERTGPIHPSFWTQWAHGIVEFSDISMDRPPAENCMHNLFRAKDTTNYLQNYIGKVSHVRQVLRDRMQFNTYVQSTGEINDR
ncbi:hypothetical protein F5X98DRAFT_325216 [Xylaria grammica]|nr:hypothetical protein F5X98DRAFT_325216 [Xylaria grammica]